MKVYIGPYKSWYGPYQLAETLCFWAKPQKDEFGIPDKPDYVHKFGEWLAHGSIEPELEVGGVRSLGDDRKKTWLYHFLLFVDSFRTRKVKVRIDRWDTWSADNTLAHIILPMIKQLRAQKHGAPWVEDEDVPLHLRSTAAPPKENEWDTDDNHFKRWDWVLDEMIFAFETKVGDLQNWEEQFRSGEMDLQWVKQDDGNFLMTHGENDTYTCDYDGMKEYQKRISNGFRLFGKYYESLWS
jgi:hypothetical protein